MIQRRPLELTPALADLYADRHPYIVIQKGAQVGVSEYLINSALWVADTFQGMNGHALYVMHTENNAHDFSQGRFDRAIAESPYLSARVRPDPPAKVIDRVGMKHIGDGYLYLRGADPRQLTSLPADIVLLDEYDWMSDEVLPLARQRLAASSLGWLRVGSTPRYPEAGINALFLRSDQHYYYLPCPRCGLLQVLTFEGNVDRGRGLLVCRNRSCRALMDLYARGEWRPSAPGNEGIRGYHLSQLYSPFANIAGIVLQSDAQSSSEEQQFMNQVLGVVHAPPGGGLTMNDLDQCRSNYRCEEYAGGATVMGVDIGIVCHVVIRDAGDGRLWFAGTVDGPTAIWELLDQYRVRWCVIDAQPDIHAMRQLAIDNPSRVWLAHYSDSQPGMRWDLADAGEPNRVRISRTEAFDSMTHRFQAKEVGLPKDARQLGQRFRDGAGEYYRQMQAPVSHLEETAAGGIERKWANAHGRPDHFAHAEIYCMAASQAPKPASKGGRLLRPFSIDINPDRHRARIDNLFRKPLW